MEFVKKTLRFISWLGIAMLQLIMGLMVTFLASLPIPVKNLENIQQTQPALLFGVMGVAFSTGVFLIGWLALKLRWLKLKPKYPIRLATTLMGAYLPMILATIINQTGMSFVLISLATGVLGFYVPGWINSEETTPILLNNLTEETTPALWNPQAAGAWSFIFSPVFGATLILMNWQAIGFKEKLRATQLWLILSIGVFIGGFFISDSIVQRIYLPFLAVWYFSEANPQAEYINWRWGKTYPRRSWLTPLIIGVGIVLLILVVAFFVGLLGSSDPVSRMIHAV